MKPLACPICRESIKANERIVEFSGGFFAVPPADETAISYFVIDLDILPTMWAHLHCLLERLQGSRKDG